MQTQLMSAVVKEYGLIRFCKSVEKGDVHISEPDLCNLVEETAKREGVTCARLIEEQTERGLMTLAQAFERTYSSPEAKELADLERRQAHNRLPVTGGFGSGTLAPMQVDKMDDEDHGEAYEKLAALAEQMHAERPELTFAKCFEKIYTSREHRGLAEAERRANRPSAATRA